MRTLVAMLAIALTSCGVRDRSRIVVEQRQPIHVFTVAQGSAWFVGDDGRTLRRVPTSGGAATDVFTAKHDITLVAIDGDDMVLGLANEGTFPEVDDIVVRSIARGTELDLGPASGALVDVQFDGDTVYWSVDSGAPLGEPSVGQLVRAERKTWVNATLATSSVTGRIGLDATHVYWGALRVPKSGGTPELRTFDTGAGVVVDGTHVLWVSARFPHGKNAIVSTDTVTDAQTVVAEVEPSHGTFSCIARRGDRIWAHHAYGSVYWLPRALDGSPVRAYRETESHDYVDCRGGPFTDDLWVYVANDNRILAVPLDTP